MTYTPVVDEAFRQRFITAQAPVGIWVDYGDGDLRVVQSDGTVMGWDGGTVWSSYNHFTSESEALESYTSPRDSRVISQEAPATTPPDPDAEAEASSEYITKAQLQEVMRELAIENNWCSEHHTPMRQLGVEPLGVEYTGEIIIRIPAKYNVNACMRDSGGSLRVDAEDLGLSWRERDQAAQIKTAVTEMLRTLGLRTTKRDNHWHLDPEGVSYELTRAERQLPAPA
jgi:hypothetical protein